MERVGLVAFPAAVVRDRVRGTAEEEKRLEQSFSHLVLDEQMGDGGRYRYRRFSRFRLEKDLRLTPLNENSIHQSLEDNPLNGGVTRTFEPLQPEVLQSPMLRSLLMHDLQVVKSVAPEIFHHRVMVGVHQVRIVAAPSQVGQPTPEGIHRDAELFTFQHLWNRHGVTGGEFLAYDQSQKESFRWLQTDRLDSVLFRGTTWHSASPIQCEPGLDSGYRDIFLIDFDH